jgi:hypothetical protein
MSKEKKVAEEAIGRIRNWLMGNAKVRGKGDLPRLAIKFCGGCNPLLDRGSISKIIREKLGEEVSWADWEEDTDLLLILNGCPASCADRPDVQKKCRHTLIISGAFVSAIEKGRTG